MSLDYKNYLSTNQYHFALIFWLHSQFIFSFVALIIARILYIQSKHLLPFIHLKYCQNKMSEMYIPPKSRWNKFEQNFCIPCISDHARANNDKKKI